MVDLLAALQKSVNAAKSARGEADEEDKPAKKKSAAKKSTKKSAAKKKPAKKAS